MKSITKSEVKHSIFTFGADKIRVVTINHSPWFVAEDVCQALKLTNPTMSLKSLDDDERSKFNLGRQGEANIVSESGMYTLVLRCRDAVNHGSVPHTFRKWVTNEVLPSIRKDGQYQKEAKARRKIKSRDDLSFTKRDEKGCLINWFVPSRVNSWHEQVAIGHEFFNEILELARHNPNEAYQALLYSGKEMMRLGDSGHSLGFAEMWAAWALQAMQSPNVLPDISGYGHKSLAIDPQEGISYWFNRYH